MTNMTSNKPYLIRAYNDWILDNNCTPYILVSAEYPNTFVPQEYVKNGQIVLNISPVAVTKLMISTDAIEFDARFGGALRHIYIPIDSVLAIYAFENGESGIGFEVTMPDLNDEGNNSALSEEKDTKNKPSHRGKPHLRVVD